MVGVSFSSTALLSIINESFEGSKKKLALESNLEPTVISKLCRDQVFTKKTLEKVCKAMSQKDAELMAHAVVRDLIPENCHSILGRRKTNLKRTFPPLDPKTEIIIFDLAELASKKKETREWLQQLAKWMFKK